MGKSEEVLTAS